MNTHNFINVEKPNDYLNVNDDCSPITITKLGSSQRSQSKNSSKKEENQAKSHCWNEKGYKLLVIGILIHEELEY